MVHLANVAGGGSVMSLVDGDDSTNSPRFYLFVKPTVQGFDLRWNRDVKLASE